MRKRRKEPLWSKVFTKIYLGFFTLLLVIGILTFNLVIIISACIFLLLVFFILHRRDALLDVEKNKIAIYEENAGGFFDVYNYTFPLVRLSIYEEFIVISPFTKKYLLYFKDIERVELDGIFFRKNGVGIRHHNKDIPSYIIIWTTSKEELMELINSKIQDN